MAPIIAPALSPSKQAAIDSLSASFTLTAPQLHRITQRFLDEFALGLTAYNHPMAMIPSFVTGVPDGTEKGTFLALDLGGTNLRVCEVSLKGDNTFTLRQAKYKVSDSLKIGEASALFDYLADSVDAFLTESGSSVPDESETLHLGFTFSFPVEQTAIDKGVLLTWTKGFAAKNAIGRDVVKLLQDAFDRKHMHVKCIALINDTVGAMLSHAYVTGGCLLGAIFGTGSNGAFAVPVTDVTKLGNHAVVSQGGDMILNTEWGAFDNARSVLPCTPFDQKLDRESINPTYQAFEKFISGMYLGEITRNVILGLVDSVPPILFGGKSTPTLNDHYGFDTSYMSSIEEAESISEIKDVIASRLGFDRDTVTDEDAEIVRACCEMVATRAASLSACAVAAVLIQTGKAVLGGDTASGESVYNVGLDGSLAEHYPNFQSRLKTALRAIVGQKAEKRVNLGIAKDGSGVGASLGALQSLKQMTR